MFWKKKKAVITPPICEHEWVLLKAQNSPITNDIFCPKCKSSKRMSHIDAEMAVERSKLRKEYLNKTKVRVNPSEISISNPSHT
ncbi:hypothetical protein BSK59_16020 [Paenibacillus odorifer]|nr:hypothetical protein BSK59_16020 [Paenibacillus odorifer]